MLDFHMVEVKGDELIFCIILSAWKAEDNDTSLSQSAHLKITSVGIAAKIL